MVTKARKQRKKKMPPLPENRKFRIAEILGLLLKACGGRCITKTKLMKLMYLMDYHFARKQKVPSFSGARYISYFYGPYSDDVEEALTLLQELGHVRQTVDSNVFAEPYYVYILEKLPNFGELNDRERVEILNFFKRHAHLDHREAREKAYATKAYKRTKFGEQIKLV